MYQAPGQHSTAFGKVPTPEALHILSIGMIAQTMSRVHHDLAAKRIDSRFHSFFWCTGLVSVIKDLESLVEVFKPYSLVGPNAIPLLRSNIHEKSRTRFQTLATLG